MNGRQERRVRTGRAPWADQEAKAAARDRAWFAAHPAQTRYLRVKITGEWGPYNFDAEVRATPYVIVTKLANGLGLKQTFDPGNPRVTLAVLAQALAAGCVLFTSDGKVIDAVDTRAEEVPA